MSEDWEQCKIVAGDGACPGGGSKDKRLSRSGSGLYYGTGHIHNFKWKTQGTARSAQRSEVDVAWRWVAWAWSKQGCYTDSQQVPDTLEQII